MSSDRLDGAQSESLSSDYDSASSDTILCIQAASGKETFYNESWKLKRLVSLVHSNGGENTSLSVERE
jgi:hypothetical protein